MAATRLLSLTTSLRVAARLPLARGTAVPRAWRPVACVALDRAHSTSSVSVTAALLRAPGPLPSRGLCEAGRLAKKKGKAGKAAKKGKTKKGGGADAGSGRKAAAAAAGDEGEEVSAEVVLESAQEAMSRRVEGLQNEFDRLRAGGASANMLDHLNVDAYGAPTSLSAVAQVTVKSATMLQVNVFDPSLSQAVADAISQDDVLNLNATADGTAVKVPIPKATKESRDAVAKVARAAAEKAKGSLRNARKQALDKVKKMKGSVSEDDLFRLQKQVEEVTSEAVDEVGSLLDAKLEDILN